MELTDFVAFAEDDCYMMSQAAYTQVGYIHTEHITLPGSALKVFAACLCMSVFDIDFTELQM